MLWVSFQSFLCFSFVCFVQLLICLLTYQCSLLAGTLYALAREGVWGSINVKSRE